MRKIADAVLYEGYLLWPYRKGATKNRQRFTFGCVHPPAYAAEGPTEQRTECLLEGGEETRLEVRVRFLHVVRRQALARRGGSLVAVEELDAGGERHLSWEEATEREVVLEGIGLGAPVRAPICVPAGSRCEELGAPGAVVRSWQPLAGAVEVGATALEPGLHRLSVRVANTTPWDGEGRDEALARTFCSTHVVLGAADGAFVSLTDPPARWRAHAEACDNAGVWPVLAGEEGRRDTVLASPIILPDHPEVAPESPGDLFDATEIDQMLVLNILSMTDEERRDMRDSDPRARAILERTERLTPEELMRLHGAIREFGLVRRP